VNRKYKTLLSSAMVLVVATFMLLSSPVRAADKGRVELVYVEWTSAVASTNVVRAVLENLGYDVKILPVSAAAMWQAVGSGDADGMVAAWLPTTHANYYRRVKGKVKDLGANLTGTRIGLVVPDYVNIDSIPQLKDNVGKFDR